jgi:hypothetical protein
LPVVDQARDRRRRQRPLHPRLGRLARIRRAWGYVVDATAAKHGASAEEDTTDAEVAYARFPERQPSAYRAGWLPD